MRRSSYYSGRSAAIFSRLYSEAISQHLWSLVAAIVCMVAIAVMSSSQTYLMGPLIDKVFLAQDHSTLGIIAAGVLAIFAIRSFARYLQEVLLVAMGQKIVAYYQVRLFEHLVTQGVADLRGQSSGSLSARFIYDANMIRAAVCDVFLTAGKDSLTILTMIGLMFFTDWKMALVCLILPILSVVPMKFLGRTVRQISLATQDEVAGLTRTLNGAFDGIRTVHHFGLADRVRRDAFGRMDALAKLVVRNAWFGGAILPVVDGIGGIAVAVVIIYGGMQVIEGALTPGELVVFVGAIVGAYAPIPSLSKTNATLQPGLAAAERVFQILDRPAALLSSDEAPNLPKTAGSIRLEGVSFTYPEGGHPALCDMDLVVPAGQVTALVGRSGAGKSTILALVSRFYDPDTGRVLINGQDARAVNPRSLRETIAVVEQSPALFDDTIAGNIRMGRLNATREAIEAAAHAAGVDRFLSELPQGLDTKVGASGTGLSAGQVQRIAIARAFLRDAPILLLDEATSSQDAESDEYIRTSVASLMKGRTVLVVAHRLETVRNADLIHVVDQGRVEESGSHEDLIAQGGLYAHLNAIRADGNIGFRPPDGSGPLLPM